MFYDQLKRLCDERGEKLTPLVKILGMSAGSIKNWQEGSYPTGDTLLKFSNYFGVSTDYLLTGEEKSSKYEGENDIINGETIKLLREKDGLYLHLAKNAKNLDMTPDDVDFILGMYEKYKK